MSERAGANCESEGGLRDVAQELTAEESIALQRRLAVAESRIAALSAHNRELLQALNQTDRVEHYLTRRRLGALIQNSPMCVHEIGLDGLVQSMNPKGLSMMALREQSEAVGVRYLDYVGEHDRARIGALMEGAFDGASAHFQFTAGEDEATRTFSSCFVPIFDEEGQVERLMGCTSEITERLRLEAAKADLTKQVLHVQKLESLGLLASGVAHDFNNVLTAVGASVELAKVQVGAEHPALTALDSAATAVELGAGFCRQLLEYAGKGESVPERYDLSRAAKKVAKVLRSSLPQGVALDVAASEEVIAQACPGQVDQIILNLIVNAADAIAGAGGSIEVATTTVEVESAAASPPGYTLSPGTYGVLTVSDDGPGIPDEIAESVFDPFFSTKSGGRGLGLAAISSIVRQHEGGLLLESQVGQGTRFAIYLPVLPASA